MKVFLLTIILMTDGGDGITTISKEFHSAADCRTVVTRIESDIDKHNAKVVSGSDKVLVVSSSCTPIANKE